MAGRSQQRPVTIPTAQSHATDWDSDAESLSSVLRRSNSSTGMPDAVKRVHVELQEISNHLKVRKMLNSKYLLLV